MAGFSYGNPSFRIGKQEPGFRYGLAPGTGVPAYRYFDGVLHVALLGLDGKNLQGADGQYLYGVAA